MVDAVGDGVTIRTEKKSPLKVVVESGGTRYGLQSLKLAEAPPSPDEPDVWVTVPPNVVRALVAVTTIAGKDESKFALSGVRLHPSWFAAANGTGFAVAWHAGLVPTPATVPAGVFDGLEGECEVALVGTRFWIRETKSGQVRWTATVEGDWPDSVIVETLATNRGEPGRVSFVIDAGQVRDLASKADVVADGLGRVFSMVAGKTELVFEKKGKGSAGDAEFRGTVAIDGPKADVTVGMEPGPIGRSCAVVAAVSAPGDVRHQMSVVGPMSPVIVWGGDPVVETLCMPFSVG
jgi:hypothetical protein